MKIMRLIKAYADFIETPAGRTTAKRLQRESVAAVLGGKSDPAWETYMKNFHSNSAQLQRLLGNEGTDKGEFMNPDSYGPTILVYVGMGGTCGTGTTMKSVIDMEVGLQQFLDDGVNEATVTGQGAVIPPELEPFLQD